ncbi:MAG: C40 family peptidase [Lachnospiraceae bacterium]|nr:C40 family peptidase [Lachnospiraceae bacterium]MBQ9579836.1 C40 family peptidase [Lachnospiraceae bacterium]
MKKRLLSLLIAAALVFSCFHTVVYVEATTKQEAERKKKEAEAKLKEVEDQIKKLKSEQAGILGQMDDVQAEIVQLVAAIDAISDEIIYAEKDLERLETELEIAIETEQRQYEAMKLRIKYMYERGDTAFVEAILGASSMADLLNQVEYFEEMYTYDRKLLVSYQETKIRTEELKNDVEVELAELNEMKEAQEGQRVALQKVMDKLESENSDYAKQLRTALAAAEQYKNTISQMNALIAQIEAEEDDDDDDDDGGDDPGYRTNVSPSDVIDYAKQFVGNPYVWGGTDPHTGADCSGFLQYVFAHFGIRIPRTSYEQRTAGKRVSYSNMKPGDIVCYSGHVAMYIGNNQILHARNERAGIGITTNPRYRSIITIRRVL